MTQILGAPVTPRSWANTLTLVGLLLLATAVAAQLALRRPSNRARAARLRGTTDPGLRGTVWTVLRVFLTYFLTPVAAWSTYQLTAAAFLPLYHTVLTALVVALLVAALWWGVTQNSPRNMGYLLLDASKTPQTPGRLSRSQDRSIVSVDLIQESFPKHIPILLSYPNAHDAHRVSSCLPSQPRLSGRA
ncbi:hypothetical protein K4K60_003362 [Colletotrichum sp. SAR11_57]|nr:hypothetical protein K4K60_003362 [Colletotrichum sp. SAR11_57]